jgi:hypothetical protein
VGRSTISQPSIRRETPDEDLPAVAVTALGSAYCGCDKLLICVELSKHATRGRLSVSLNPRARVASTRRIRRVRLSDCRDYLRRSDWLDQEVTAEPASLGFQHTIRKRTGDDRVKVGTIGSGSHQ